MSSNYHTRSLQMSYMQCTPYFRTDISGWLLHLLMIILSIFEQIPPPPPSPRRLAFPFSNPPSSFSVCQSSLFRKTQFFVGNEASYGPFCGFLLGLGDKLFLHLHFHKYGIWYQGVNVVQETTKILGHRAFQINTTQKISRFEVSECLSF